MALLTWDASYSVKVAKCDEDHKKLFSLLNALHEAMKVGKGTQILHQVVADLANYARLHFAREEALLEMTKYPALAPHRAQHEEFVRRVAQFQQDLKTGNTNQSIAVANFLTDWLVKHIQQTDVKYSAHLNANGVS
jgi:hemerythrin